LPYQAERLTVTNERVGPRDYMPQWGDLGDRLENVATNFDVYMLGKLLWCMVAGRLKLPREYHKRDQFNLTVLFPNNPDMHAINEILARCVVEESKNCLASADDLLTIVNTTIARIERGGQLLSDGVPRPCRVCGTGLYQPAVLRQGVQGKPVFSFSLAGAPVEVRPFTCDHCGHMELFKVNY
jgi:hypothetical protein